jgi:hypothetical protein
MKCIRTAFLWKLLATGAFIPAPAAAQWLPAGFGDGDMAADLTEALTFHKYPTYPQYLEMMNLFQQEYPGISRLDTIGTSAEGRLLLALKISDNVKQDEPEPSFFYTSTIHGDELVGMVLLLRLASTLLEGYGSDQEVTGLVDGLSIWINPLANPDGTYGADSGLSVKGAIRFNADGVDLNRDFPWPGLDLAGDTSGRAPETRAMISFLQGHQFNMSATLHSGSEVVNYPWDHTRELHADDDWFRFVSREYADEAKAVDPGYMALFTDGITNGAAWYPVQGGRQDYMNYFRECREVTLELSEEKLLLSDSLEEYWEKNRRSLINYMSQCTYGIRGTVTDAETGDPLRAAVFIPDHDQSYSAVHSSEAFGDFYRPIKEGRYDLIFSSPGYLDDTIPEVHVSEYQTITLEVGLGPDPDAQSRASNDPVLGLYPNPAGERVFLSPENTGAGEMAVRVFGLDGTLFLNSGLTFAGEPVGLDLEQLFPGFYILRVTMNGLVLSAPLIVQ